MPPVLLVATGGTIASTVQDDGSVQVSLAGTQLVDAVPGVDRAAISVVDIEAGPSWNFDGTTMERIARTAIDALTRGEASGVVVTHGTDAIEETLWLTDLLHHDAARSGPIVFTGAMRNASHPEPDGPGNLRDALLVAAAPDARGRGALLSMNGQLHRARWVTKTDTDALDTFRSPIEGASGYVIDGEVLFQAPPATRPSLPPVDAIDPAVVAVPSHGGLPGETIDWLLDRGAHGVVVEATGAGNVNERLVPGVERALGAGVPVVVASRCRGGAVGPIYGGPGGGHTLGALGVIAAGDLTAWKAGLALMVALGADPSVDAVRAWFASLLDSP